MNLYELVFFVFNPSWCNEVWFWIQHDGINFYFWTKSSVPHSCLNSIRIIIHIWIKIKISWSNLSWLYLRSLLFHNAEKLSSVPFLRSIINPITHHRRCHFRVLNPSLLIKSRSISFSGRLMLTFFSTTLLLLHFLHLYLLLFSSELLIMDLNSLTQRAVTRPRPQIQFRDNLYFLELGGGREWWCLNLLPPNNILLKISSIPIIFAMNNTINVNFTVFICSKRPILLNNLVFKAWLLRRHFPIFVLVKLQGFQTLVVS